MNWKYGEKIDNRKEKFNLIEKKWNVVLPQELKDILVENDHATPEDKKGVFKTANGEERVFGGFLYFNLDVESNVLNDYEIIKDRLPDKVFPFAEDPGGNFICFDYKVLDNNGSPKVVFWDHEYQMDKKNPEVVHYVTTFIASSFSEFLNCLYKGESFDDDYDFSKVNCSW